MSITEGLGKGAISLGLKGLAFFFLLLIFVFLIVGIAAEKEGFFYAEMDEYDFDLGVEELWFGWKGFSVDGFSVTYTTEPAFFEEMDSPGSAAVALLVLAMIASLVVAAAIGASIFCALKMKQFAVMASAVAMGFTVAVWVLDSIAWIVMIAVFNEKLVDDELQLYTWTVDYAFVLQLLNCALWVPAVLVSLGVAIVLDR
ncbi:hypothetical protein QOT17_021091 [Balamuthia mandrillaris]